MHQTDNQDAIRIFYSYARPDKKFCDELEKHLTTMKQSGSIVTWNGYEVLPGKNWNQEVDNNITQADIVLVLVSPDFLASSYHESQELRRALERHQKGQTLVIPIILRHCDWKRTPLGQMKALPDRDKPIKDWRNTDKVFYDIAQKLQETVDELHKKKNGRQQPQTLIHSSSASLVHPPPIQATSHELRVVNSDVPIIHISGFAGEDIVIQVGPPPQQTSTSIPSYTGFAYNLDRLPDASEFYGRINEWKLLIDRCRNNALTSITGPRRSGKTWFMQYLQMEAPGVLGPKWRVGYVNAALPDCETVVGFVKTTLEKLGITVLTPALLLPPMLLLQLVIKALVAHDMKLIVCIDKIYKFRDRDEFDIFFFGHLRAIGQESLVLVTASNETLLQTFGANNRTSDFFNGSAECKMIPFSKQEAQAFLQAKGQQTGITRREQEALLQVSGQATGWYPVRLQLAGHMLFEDKQRGLYKGRIAWDEYWSHFKQELDDTYANIKGPL